MKEAKDEWIKYTKKSTFHGLERAFDQSRNLGRRVVWLLLISGTFLFMVYTVSLGVSRLLHPEYTTQVSVQRVPSITFPAVTFCSNNMYRKSYVEKYPEVLAYIMRTAPKFAKYLTDNKTLMALARAVSLKHIDQQKLTRKLTAASHPPLEIIRFTTAFGARINRTNVVPVLTSMGVCYRLNTTNIVKASGQDKRLRVNSLVNSDEYFFNKHSFGAMGIKLLPHSPGVFPEVHSKGIGAGAKTDTFISMQKRITHLLPETGCVAEGSKVLELYDTYSQSACMNECTVKHRVDVCGCKHYYHPGNYSLCVTREDFYCIRQLANNESYPEMSCDCPPKCVEETFDTKIFGMPFPSQYTKDLYKRKGNRKNWDKIARTTIYFESMDVITITQRRSYSLEDFFSDVGGLMGLWLGASVITWAELIEVLWDTIINLTQRQKSKKIYAKNEVKKAWELSGTDQNNLNVAP